MKKSYLIITTTALALTTITSSISLAQTSGNQTGELTIECPSPGSGPSIANTPDNITFESKTSTAAAQDGFDSDVADNTDLTAKHLIEISDLRSGGVENCITQTPGWTLSISSTDLDRTGGGGTIPKSSLRVITSNEIATPSGYVAQEISEKVLYPTSAPTGGFAQDVEAPVLYDDANFDPLVTNNLFKTATSYTSITTNKLENPVTLLSKTTGQNGKVATGVAIMIDQGIAAFQPAGTYQGTITYTVMAL